jgi:hypothetical protein
MMLRCHLAPFFKGRGIDVIDRRGVVAYQREKLESGLSPKTVANHVRFLHGISALRLARSGRAEIRLRGSSIRVIQTGRTRYGPLQPQSSSRCLPPFLMITSDRLTAPFMPPRQ